MAGRTEDAAEAAEVGIVGAGPAGLMAAHLLRRAGISTVNLDHRDAATIHATHRAGILEHGSVRMLSESDLESRVLDEGHRHDGIDLRFDGVSHRIDFQDLIGESVWLYPQNEVFWDLHCAAERHGMDVRYGVSNAEIHDADTESPSISWTDPEGAHRVLRCEYIIGADGSRSICRRSMPQDARREYAVEYPFAWFGILAETVPSAPELIYATSPRGFALISQRSESVQRMYFQCSPDEDPQSWSDEQIWDELQARVDGPDGFRLKRGPIFDRNVLTFRSRVTDPMSWGRLHLAGDAGHTVPPTGAKGLNLALADVRILAPALIAALRGDDVSGLQAYSRTALNRVWKAQNFSYRMTRMLHRREDETAFERARLTGELRSIVESRHGKAYLAEAYTGWPDAQERP